VDKEGGLATEPAAAHLRGSSRTLELGQAKAMEEKWIVAATILGNTTRYQVSS
jgi:hypothetical protein